MSETLTHLWKIEHGAMERAWGLYLVAAGSGEAPEAVPDADWMLLVAVRGAGYLGLPGRRRLRLEAGEVALVASGAGPFTPEPGRGCRVHHLQFAGEVAARWLAPGLLGPLPRVIRTGFDEPLLALLSRLMDMARRPDPEQGRPMAGLLAHLLARLDQAARQAGRTERPGRLVQEARRLLADPDRQDLPPEALARELGVSYSWFRRCFRRQTGLGPQGYRARRRLERACEALVDTRLPIGAIAADLGFSSQGYFARWFRKATGLSPSVWRSSRPRR